MRLLTALVIAVVLAACSSSDEQATGTASTSQAPTSGRQEPSAVTESPPRSESEVAATSSTTSISPTDPDPFVGVGQIDSATRSSDGALVITRTGYEWGGGPCQEIAQAHLRDPIEMIIEVTVTVGPSPDGACAAIAYAHALTVVGAADLDSDTIVDAFDGTTIPIADGIEQIQPSWYTDRPVLPSCGTDTDYDEGPAEQNADARSCFQNAYSTRTPAEIEVVSYGDEGESAHRLFRIVDAERLEVLEEFRPPVDGDVTTGSPWTWSTYGCESFAFIDEPGFETGGRPVLNANSECVVERTQL
jgi:hypothetical protein